VFAPKVPAASPAIVPEVWVPWKLLDGLVGLHRLLLS
jgi:hypothetical protein